MVPLPLDPRQGYTIGQTYYHPVLAFKIVFPDDWRIINQRSAVGALSPRQDAAVVLTLSDKPSPQAAFDAFFGQQGIQKGPSRGRNMFAFRAYDTQTGAGTAEGVISFLSHGGRIYQLMGYTGLETWDAYGRAMQASVASFANVTERRYLEVDPATVAIVEVPRRMTFAEFNQRYPSTIEPTQLGVPGRQGGRGNS